MTRRKGRCLQCFVTSALVASLVWTGTAMAQAGPASSISAEAWLGLIATAFFALVAGYVGRQNAEFRDHKTMTAERFSAVRMEQNQLQAQFNLLRESVQEKHPSRPEFEAMRDDMHRGFDEVKQLIRGGH